MLVHWRCFTVLLIEDLNTELNNNIDNNNMPATVKPR